MKIIFSFLILILGTSISYSQKIDPVKWEFKAEKVGDSKYKIVFKANIDKSWAIYSQFTPEGGPIPTRFHFDENENIEFIDSVIETENVVSQYDDMFGMKVIKIKGNPEFYQMIKTDAKDSILKGYLTFMCCDDTKCLAPKDINFEIPLQ